MRKEFKLFLGNHDRAFTAAVKEVLERSFRVTVGHDGATILNMLLETQPDLAILDFTIPELDVLELCEKLRNDQPHISSVIYVPLEHLLVAKRKWKRRAIDYIAGPLEVSEFCEEVNKVVRYLLLNQERETLIRHKIETNYFINKKMAVLKDIAQQAIQNNDLEKVSIIIQELQELETTLRDIETFNL